MSFLKKIFGISEIKIVKNRDINWIQLTNISQLNEINEISRQKPVIIFKHSTTCSISRMVLKIFELEYNLQDKVEPYFLDLLNFRVISNEIAIKFGVEHQSPQMLLIKNGESVYDASHSNISAENFFDKIKELE